MDGRGRDEKLLSQPRNTTQIELINVQREKTNHLFHFFFASRFGAFLIIAKQKKIIGFHESLIQLKNI